MWLFGPNRYSGQIEALETAVRQLRDAATPEVPPEVLTAPEAISELQDQLSQFETRVAHELRELTIAIDEGIQRVERSERRVRQVVQRARKRVDKGEGDAGLDAEAAEFFGGDGDAGDEGQLPTVHEDMASSIPGVTVGQLRRARGYS